MQLWSRPLLAALGLVASGPLALALVSCGGSEFRQTEARIVIAADRISFGPLLVGGTATRTLEVRNQGAGSATIVVEVEAPFSVDPPSLVVRGGEVRQLSFQFAPQVLGEQEGAAALRWGNGAAEVALDGEAVEAQRCEPAGPCHTVRFEPGSGCVEEWIEDGTPCEDLCLEGSVCQRGQCVGTERNCDDGDPCTFDSCDRRVGCRNDVDPERVCGEPADPCMVPGCDPDGGCTLQPVSDGVPCGPASCSLAHVCIAGTCSQRKPATGGLCGEASPCRQQGRCIDDVCVQDPASPLALRWAQSPPPGWDLRFDGLVDPTGRLLWVECADQTCVLAAASPRGGGSTLRATMFQGGAPAPVGRTLLQGQVVVSTHRHGWVEAYRSADGVRLWGVELGDRLPAQANRWEVVELAAHGDRVFALVEAWGAEGLVEGWAVAVALEGGELLWKVALGGSFDGLVVDERGRLVFTLIHPPSNEIVGALVSFSSAGTERWRLPADAGGPLAVAHGRLLDRAGNLRRVDDGFIDRSLSVRVPLHSESALLRFEEGALFGYPLEPCSHDRSELCPVWAPHLVSFDPWQGGIEWLLSVASAEGWDRTEPVATEVGSILFAEPSPGHLQGGCERRFRLVEIGWGDRAETLFSCDLPGGSQGYLGPASLQDGLWAVANTCENRLEVFDLGAFGAEREWSTASQGWVTARGNPGRTGTPR